MAKVKYNVKGVESGQDFDTPIPVGLYKAEITECSQGVSKASGNDMLTVVLDIVGDKDWKGRKLWDYIVLNDASAWKLRQLLEAVGLVKGKKETGTLDTDKIVGTKIQVRVRHQGDPTGEFGTRAKVGALLPLPGDVDDDEEEPEDEDVEPEDETDEGTEEDLTLEDLEGYDRDELEELIEDNELDVSYNKRTSDDTLRERIAEELELEAEESEDEEEPDTPDYSEWSVADLKKELKSRDLSAAGTKKTLIKKLEKDDEGDGDEPF